MRLTEIAVVEVTASVSDPRKAVRPRYLRLQSGEAMDRLNNLESQESRWLARVCVVAFLFWLPFELLRGVIPSTSIHSFLADQAFGNVAQAMGALGAVLAIGGAAYVTRAQIEAAAAQAREVERRASEAASTAASTSARNAVAAISAEVDLINEAMPVGNAARLTLHKFRLLEAAALGKSVRLEHLKLPQQAAVISANAVAAGLLGSLAIVFEARDSNDRSAALGLLAEVASAAAETMARNERDVVLPT